MHVVTEKFPRNLADYVRTTGPLDECTASLFTRSLLSALSYLHGLDIVHRDIKPDNLLVDDKPHGTFTKPRLVVCDFGLSNFLDRNSTHDTTTNGLGTTATTTDSIVSECVLSMSLLPGARTTSTLPGAGAESGTLHKAALLDGLAFSSAIAGAAYCAPEIVERERFGAPVDVYAAGVVLYYMLSGRLPFAGDDPNAVLEKVRDGEGVDFSGEWAGDVSADAVTLIKSMLMRDQRRRITVEAALQHPWILRPPVQSQSRTPSAPPIIIIPDVTNGRSRSESSSFGALPLASK
jgi:serine/threonine protein kinase